MDNFHLNIFSKMAIEQSHEDVAHIISNMELCSINKIASMRDAEQLYMYFSDHRDVTETTGQLYKLASLEASVYPAEQSLLYTGIIKLAQEAKSLIRDKVRRLSRAEALLLIHEIASKNDRLMLFSTKRLFKLDERTVVIDDLLSNIRFKKAYDFLSLKSENIDYYCPSFKKVIKRLNLNSYGIADIASGVSKLDQFQALISHELISTRESALLAFLENENKYFTAFEKLMSKTLNSPIYSIRIESIEYIKDKGFKIGNTDVEIDIFTSQFRDCAQTALKNIIEKSNKKINTKKSRIKQEEENPRTSVLIEMGNIEKLQGHPSHADSKTAVLRNLFEVFIKMPHKTQSALIRRTTVATRKKAKNEDDVDSHQKTDFTVSKKLENQINQLRKKHRIQLQPLTNILVNHAIQQCSCVDEHTENLTKHAVTASAQSQPSTPDTRPPNPHYEIREEEKLTPKPSGISPDKIKDLASILGKKSY